MDIAASFIRHSAWGQILSEQELEKVVASAVLKSYGRNERVVFAGEEACHWIGVIKGLGVQAIPFDDGKTTYMSVGAEGTWFGEGTLLKRERWGYDAIALRDTTVVLVPIEAFEWLRARSLPFNHFLQVLLNHRLGMLTSMLLTSRHGAIEARIAQALLNLNDAEIYPSVSNLINMSQTELSLLIGTSRQRLNSSLKELTAIDAIAVERNGIVVLNRSKLRAVATSAHRLPHGKIPI